MMPPRRSTLETTGLDLPGQSFTRIEKAKRSPPTLCANPESAVTLSGTLDKVTALSGFAQSVGGERFAFSILVNDWPGRSSPVVSSVDRLGGIIASAGTADLPALANPGAPELQPAELKARVATYAAMAAHPDKKNLPSLRTSLR